MSWLRIFGLERLMYAMLWPGLTLPAACAMFGTHEDWSTFPGDLDGTRCQIADIEFIVIFIDMNGKLSKIYFRNIVYLGMYSIILHAHPVLSRYEPNRYYYFGKSLYFHAIQRNDLSNTRLNCSSLIGVLIAFCYQSG